MSMFAKTDWGMFPGNMEPRQNMVASLSRGGTCQSLELLKRLVFVRQDTKKWVLCREEHHKSVRGILRALGQKLVCPLQGKFPCVLPERWPESRTEIPEGVGVSNWP